MKTAMPFPRAEQSKETFEEERIKVEATQTSTLQQSKHKTSFHVTSAYACCKTLKYCGKERWNNA